MLILKEYQEPSGRSPFSRWFKALDAFAAAKVTVTLARLEAGNTSSLKGVGGGVLESRIDFGPGYRVYLARDGETLVILLGGGTKKRQSEDIANAVVRWIDYKARKKAAAVPAGKPGGRTSS
jgi:putative addiction module killer protein